MKKKFIENGIEYVRNGDYYIPNLTVPDDKVYNIGRLQKQATPYITEARLEMLPVPLPPMTTALQALHSPTRVLTTCGAMVVKVLTMRQVRSYLLLQALP